MWGLNKIQKETLFDLEWVHRGGMSPGDLVRCTRAGFPNVYRGHGLVIKRLGEEVSPASRRCYPPASEKYEIYWLADDCVAVMWDYEIEVISTVSEP